VVRIDALAKEHVKYDSYNAQELGDLINSLTEIESAYSDTMKDQAQLAHLFRETRSFGPYRPAMVAVDGKNQLLAFRIEPVMGWVELQTLILHFAEVIGAEAQHDGHVIVHTSFTGLPAVLIPTDVSVNFVAAAGWWASIRDNIVVPLAYNTAVLAAQFINDIVRQAGSVPQADNPPVQPESPAPSPSTSSQK